MREKYKEKAAQIASEFGPATLEKQARVGTKGSKLYIGLPKEHSFQENRIALTPQSVAVLTANGHRIVIESQAGEASNFPDVDYSNAGAEVVNNVDEVFKAEIIIKVTPLLIDEIEKMYPYQIVISPIHLSTLEEEYINTLIKKKVTALAFEYIKDESGAYPFVRSMSEIAGSTSILLASELLSNDNEGKGILFGGISGVNPAKVLILGAGMVGESATIAALGLGADVKIFDNSIYKIMRLQNNIGRRVSTSIIHPDTIAMELKTADVAIGAIHSSSGRSPLIVTEAMVKEMKFGSVIVDVSIDQGGCFETSEVTSHDNPTFRKFDVVHYCVPNIASRVSRTASYAISNILTPTLSRASLLGGFEQLLADSPSARHGIYVFKGRLTNVHLSERFNINSTDVDLLFASSF